MILTMWKKLKLSTSLLKFPNIFDNITFSYANRLVSILSNMIFTERDQKKEKKIKWKYIAYYNELPQDTKMVHVSKLSTVSK